MSVPLILVDIIIQLNFWVWFFVGFAIDAKFSCKQTVGVILKHKNQVLIGVSISSQSETHNNLQLKLWLENVVD